jgi:dihydroorotase (multifunctional complex type)
MQRISREGGRDLAAFFRSRPPESEVMGVARACVMAEATGARVHLRQMSTRPAIALLRDFRRRANGLSAEVTPHNLLFSDTSVAALGPYAKVAPPLREEDHRIAAWEGLADGTLDIVATDHAPHLESEKEAGRDDIWKAPGGFPGVQTLVPLMLNSAAAGDLSYQDVVRLVSENPARLFGLFPKKGTIAVGADADLIIVDPQRESIIRNEDQHSRARVTPFAGRRVRGAVTTTLLRGSVIMQDGVVADTASGQFVAPDRGQSQHC